MNMVEKIENIKKSKKNIQKIDKSIREPVINRVQKIENIKKSKINELKQFKRTHIQNIKKSEINELNQYIYFSSYECYNRHQNNLISLIKRAFATNETIYNLDTYGIKNNLPHDIGKVIFYNINTPLLHDILKNIINFNTDPYGRYSASTMILQLILLAAQKLYIFLADKEHISIPHGYK